MPDGADHVERSPAISEMRAEPAGQPEIGNADRVIGMKMGEEQRVDSADGHAKLKQPHSRAAPGIDQERSDRRPRSACSARTDRGGGSAPPSRAALREIQPLRLHLHIGIGDDLLPVRDLDRRPAAKLLRRAACRLGANLRQCFRTDDFCSALLIAPFSRATVSFGVPRFTAKPVQSSTTSDGKPASTMVGTSGGSARASVRSPQAPAACRF